MVIHLKRQGQSEMELFLGRDDHVKSTWWRPRALAPCLVRAVTSPCRLRATTIDADVQVRRRLCHRRISAKTSS